jgi:hypothetical protein
MTSGKSELADKTPLVRANDCVVIDSAPCSWFGRKLTAMQGVTSGSQGPIRDRRDAVLMVAGGCLAFLFSVTAGIERWGGLDPSSRVSS